MNTFSSSATSQERPGRVRSRPLKPLKAPVKSQKETKEISSLTKTTKGEKSYFFVKYFILSLLTFYNFFSVQRKEALPPISVQPAQAGKEESDIVPDAPNVKIDLPIDQVFINCRRGQIFVLMNSQIFHNNDCNNPSLLRFIKLIVYGRGARFHHRVQFSICQIESEIVYLN